MRKPSPDFNSSSSAISVCQTLSPRLVSLSPGDSLIDAIAEAVASKIERMAGMGQRLLDVHDAAKYLGMTEDALRHKAGVDVPCIRVDGKLRFDRRDLDRWIDRAPRQGI